MCDLPTTVISLSSRNLSWRHKQNNRKQMGAIFVKYNGIFINLRSIFCVVSSVRYIYRRRIRSRDNFCVSPNMHLNIFTFYTFMCLHPNWISSRSANLHNYMFIWPEQHRIVRTLPNFLTIDSKKIGCDRQLSTKP